MKPRILLIGAGAFGSKHLQTLIDLHHKKALILAGVVVNTEKSAAKLAKSCPFPVHCGFSEKLLHEVDAVDIVTPAETHYDLVCRCLPLVHVLVEKPLSDRPKQARMLKKLASHSKHILMVGHIFRFHPVLTKLKEILARPDLSGRRPLMIESSFINPADSDKGREIELELLHPFDMVDFLFGLVPKASHLDDRGRIHVVTLTYPRHIVGLFRLGWSGTRKERTLKLIFADRHIVCDIEKNTIDIHQNGKHLEHSYCTHPGSPLETELHAFVAAMQKNVSTSFPDATVGERVVHIATMSGNRATETANPPRRRKKVAIIGAGIFGLNCAIELAPECDVTVFEKNEEILSEASKINQYRHHWGYHYPRSQETVDDIRLAMKDFEDRYQAAIVTKFPTYYSVAKKGSKVTAAQFTKFCRKNKLPYSIEFPGPEFLDRSKVSTCLKTYEPIYDYEKLNTLTARLLRERGVTINLGQEVIGAHSIGRTGQKSLTIRTKKGKIAATHQEFFDYVVNATYARQNEFCQWLGFRKKPIRVDLVEVLWVKLNSPKISLAVMDGKFTNIVPTGRDSIFTLVHIEESVLRRFVPQNGLVPQNIFASAKRTRVQKIIERSAEWFPFVKKAKVLHIHHVLRGVSAYREHDDARISDITEHGFGCFSVFGGKIINSVWIAKQLRNLIVS
jgi:predicted dehydrogenase